MPFTGVRRFVLFLCCGDDKGSARHRAARDSRLRNGLDDASERAERQHRDAEHRDAEHRRAIALGIHTRGVHDVDARVRTARAVRWRFVHHRHSCAGGARQSRCGEEDQACNRGDDRQLVESPRRSRESRGVRRFLREGARAVDAREVPHQAWCILDHARRIQRGRSRCRVRCVQASGDVRQCVVAERCVLARQ